MKTIKQFSFYVLLFAASVFATSCGGNHNHDHDGEHVESAEQQGKEHTSAYVCPMHCEGSGSEEAGKCPVCGMDYVANDDHKEDGHKH